MRRSLIILSALAIYSALAAPAWSCISIFFYLIPLFYLVQEKGQLSFYDGFLWGAVLYTLHWYDIAFIAHARGYGLARYGVMPFLVIYCASHAGLWFWLASKLSAYTQREAHAWIFSTWLYTIYMQRYVFWIFGRIQGYPLSFPLIPLAQYPQTLYALPHIHPQVLLLMLIIGSWCCAALLYGSRGLIVWVGVLGGYAPFSVGLMMGQCENPMNYANVGYVSPQGLSTAAVERAGGLARRCNELLCKQQGITHIVMPESTLPLPLNEDSEIFQAFAGNIEHNEVILLIGSQKKEDNMHFNCCFMLRHSLIIQRYDKQLLLPFTEYLPNIWSNFDVFKRIFLHDKKIMNVSRKEGRFLAGFCPLICSDYYLDWYDERQETAVPLLLMVNENWFNDASLKHLMYLAARYGAIARRQDIIYVGHTKACAIAKTGQVWPLPSNQEA